MSILKARKTLPFCEALIECAILLCLERNIDTQSWMPNCSSSIETWRISYRKTACNASWSRKS